MTTTTEKVHSIGAPESHQQKQDLSNKLRTYFECPRHLVSVLICSDHHQIWQVCSLIHDLEVFFFEILIFIDFIGFFVCLGLGQFLRWNPDHVQIVFLWVLYGKWLVLR